MAKILKNFRLNDRKEIERFDCGDDYLNRAIRESIVHSYFNHEINIKLIRDDKDILAVCVYRIAKINVEIKELEDTLNYPYLFISYFAIKKDIQNQGLGSIVFEELMKDCKALINGLNLRGVALDSVKQAINFYSKFGFEVIETDINPKENLMILNNYNEDDFVEYYSEFDE